MGDGCRGGRMSTLPPPFYSDENKEDALMAETRFCACGCGAAVPSHRQYVSGHNLRGQIKTPEHCARISMGQKEAWQTKREGQRRPIGSRRLDANGYTLVKVRRGGGRWDKEHVLVMESHIGRKLFPGEAVHHINGVRTDNRIENLYLCSDNAEHMRAEFSAKSLIKSLIDDGIVGFDQSTGRYYRK